MSRKIDPEALYDADDISQLLGIQVQTVRRLIREGKIVGKKLARRWFVSGKALLDYFEEEGREMQELHER